jgi:uncharacterized protein (DUF305 family)
MAACAAAPPAADAPPAPRTVQPGAPGEATRPVEVGDAAGPSHTPADVRFMRHMIAHHAQALEMSALVPERSSHDQVRLLARRIAMGQADEMALMEHWLRARGEAAAEPAEAHHHHDHAGAHHGMPGMLTAPQMARLAAASGPEFDRLFLEAMIFHHEGALDMVEELFATPGAGEEAEVYQFAAHVDNDQRIEIARMYRLLNALITP